MKQSGKEQEAPTTQAALTTQETLIARDAQAPQTTPTTQAAQKPSVHLDDINQYLDDNWEDMVAQLDALVQIPSVGVL